VVPRRFEHVENRRAHRERSAEAVDQLTGFRADNFCTEDAPALGLGEHLHVAVVLIHQDGLPVVVKRIAGGDVGRGRLTELAFAGADPCHRRRGEDDAQ